MENKYIEAIKVLRKGGIVVMPSDTVYGIFASTKKPRAIERVYSLRNRSNNKPCIVLVSHINKLSEFGINVSSAKKKVLKRLWSGRSAVTIVLSCPQKKMEYLHRGKKSIAFRIPSKHTSKGQKLLTVLNKTGPLIAPSANPAGKNVAETTAQAKKYFGSDVDHYVAYGRKIKVKPSQIFDYTTNNIKKIR